jgi:hypothetical protein
LNNLRFLTAAPFFKNRRLSKSEGFWKPFFKNRRFLTNRRLCAKNNRCYQKPSVFESFGKAFQKPKVFDRQVIFWKKPKVFLKEQAFKILRIVIKPKVFF